MSKIYYPYGLMRGKGGPPKTALFGKPDGYRKVSGLNLILPAGGTRREGQ